MPSSEPSRSRLNTGTLVIPKIDSAPVAGSTSASSARGSSGTAPCRPISTSISTTWSARANAPATSPKPRVKSAATLPPGNSAGEPGAAAAAASSTAGASSMSRSTSSAASSAAYGSPATTTATGSPTYRTVPVASTGCR